MTSSNDTAHALIDRLIADFGDHPGLACVVTRSGHGYRRRANDARREGLSTEAEADNLKAVALYDRVINEFASSPFVASSYFFSALCYRDLGQWQDALACCNGQCYNINTHKCCTDGETDYICEIDENCCDGDCCDPVTKQCCNDIGGDNDGYCCDKDCEICCEGTCCKNYQCCIDGQCVDPICDNCHAIVNQIIYECGHEPADPCGTPCATDWCIKNTLNSATCDHKEDWPCPKSNCDTTTDPPNKEVFQRAFNAPCPGGYVTEDPTWIMWSGCTSCGSHGYLTSCTTGSCDENDPRGPGVWKDPPKYKCGGCGGCP